jgi:hypothetical protein
MRRWAIPPLIFGCLAGLVVACYGRAIFRGEQFAYRDAAHYYYPLHKRVQAEWDAGRWPLWEPEENSGMPLMGNPTAAVLYPGKLAFALFRYPLAARLYIIGHTLLAFAAMLALLRHWGTSWVGSTLGASAYAFGGPVLFQYCNVIYLVGAAWVPLGFRATDRWLRLGRRIALAELAAVLAMETLGGDPESAYLTGVCAAAYAAALAWRGTNADVAEEGGAPPGSHRPKLARRVLGAALLLTLWIAAVLAAERGLAAFLPAPAARTTRLSLPWAGWTGPVVAAAWGLAGLVLLMRWRRLRRTGARPPLVPMLFGLLAAAAVGAAAAAAQLLPALEFAGQSGRAAAEGPHDIYPFSLNPARVVELAWPNAFGTAYRGNRLWLGALPPRDPDVKAWVHTLYLGGLTLVLALGGARLGSGGAAAPWRAWMAAVAAIGLLGSFGEYGSPLWYARRVPALAETAGPRVPTDAAPPPARRVLRDGDGGVYWLLAAALPGFNQFRYPSKLLTFTALGLAALAAQGWDALAAGDPRARRLTAAWSGALLAPTLVALALSVVFRDQFLAWLRAQGLASVFGPFDAPGALAETQGGLVQAALVLAVSLVLTLRLAGRRPATAAALALVVTAVDLASANAPMVTTVPQSLLDAPPEVVSAIERSERDDPRPGPYRVYRVPAWSPVGWGERASADRVIEFVDWQRQTAEPKFGINDGIHYTRTIGVAELHDYEWFFGGFYYGARDRAARVLGVGPGTQLLAYPRRSFDIWNTRYFVLPYSVRWGDDQRGIASFIERTERIHPPPDAFKGAGGRAREDAWVRDHDYQVRRNLDDYPRAWVVHEARSLPPLRTLDRAARDVAMQEVLFSNDMIWTDPTRIVYDPRRYVWLEDSAVPELAPHLPGSYPSARETVRVVRHEPDRVELEAVLERPGIVVLADVHYPGWTLAIDGRAAPIYRVNSMMRGAAVAAGRHTLVYSYHPASFRIGLVVSGLGLGALGLLGLWSALPGGRRDAASAKGSGEGTPRPGSLSPFSGPSGRL